MERQILDNGEGPKIKVALNVLKHILVLEMLTLGDILEMGKMLQVTVHKQASKTLQ